MDAIAAAERTAEIVERQIELDLITHAVASLGEFSRSIAKVVAIYHGGKLDESGPIE